MTVAAVLMLLGQVGNGGEYLVSPNDSAAPVAVDTAASEAPPARPPVSGPARPGLRPPVQIADSPDFDAARFGEPRSAVPPADLQPPDSAAPVSATPSFETGPIGQRRVAPASAATAVSPTTAPEATPPATPAASPALQIASQMMQEVVAVDSQSQAAVHRIPLVDALSRLSDPGQQATAIRAYWDLARSIAHVRYAADQIRVLSEVPAPSDPAERALLEEAITAAEAQEAAAQNGLLAAQYHLLRVTGLPLENVLPWPADAPLVAPYRTQFESIFATRSAPLGVRQIHHALPGKLWLIEKRLNAMAAAESSFDTVSSSQAQAAVPLTQVLASINRLDHSRHAFLDAVIDYNNQIAEYSLAVVGVQVGPDVLVATLIKSAPTPAAMVAVPSREVRQATAAEVPQGNLITR